jgi:hypothetical protein
LEAERRFNLELWDRTDEGEPASDKQPFCAIEKELFRGNVPFTVKLAKRALRDLNEIRWLEGYHIKARNANNFKASERSIHSLSISGCKRCYDESALSVSDSSKWRRASAIREGF